MGTSKTMIFEFFLYLCMQIILPNSWDLRFFYGLKGTSKNLTLESLLLLCMPTRALSGKSFE